MKKLIIGGLAALAATVGIGLAAPNTASAAPPQNCQTTWNTMYGVPVGTRTTCFNPDGSYSVCSSLGTAGNGPGTCWNYPAPPAPNPGNLLPINPPVPGVTP
jgi:hypothetical protein